MTDRELLEKAARAAGIFLTPEKLAELLPKWEWCEGFEPFHTEGGGMTGTVIWFGSKGDIGGTARFDWNPLHDDGDALRLAVKLNLQVTPGTYREHEATVYRAGAAEAHECVHYQQDLYAATRRAIVRAAAAIHDAKGQ